MRLSSQNNQFIFNLPTDLLSEQLEAEYQKIIDKNFVQYLTPIDFINSTIIGITFPAMSFENAEQILKRGKKIGWKDARNVRDNFTSELDITMRSVDSQINYFMMMRSFVFYSEDTKNHYLSDFALKVIDYNGDLIYTVIFREVLLKSLSELRLEYNSNDFQHKTFTMTFRYNFLDIYWEVGDDRTPIHEDIYNLPDVPVRTGRDTDINGKIIPA